jgi:hypothetical protein
LLVFAAAFGAVTLAVFLPFIPDGGLKELYDRTLGFQEDRQGWMTIWGWVPGLTWLQTLLHFAVAGLAILVAFVPRQRTLVQVAALGGALLVAFELTGTNWFSAYAVWFAPTAFLALLGAYGHQDRYSRPARAVGKPPSERAALARSS